MSAPRDMLPSVVEIRFNPDVKGAIDMVVINDNDKLKLALEAASEKAYTKALELCDDYIQTYRESPDGFRTRSQVHSMMGDFSGAIEDRTKAMELGTLEPGDFFFCGWWNLELNQLDAALKDLTDSLKLAEQLDTHEFDQSAFFFRSVTYLRMRRYSEALADSEHVGDDFLIYLRSGRISKADVVQQATRQR